MYSFLFLFGTHCESGTALGAENTVRGTRAEAIQLERNKLQEETRRKMHYLGIAGFFFVTSNY